MVAAVEGGLQGQELVEGHAQCINVGALVNDAAPGQGLLGAHVAQCPDHVAGVRQAEIAGKPSQAKVGDPEGALRIDQEVSRLDVAMKDAQAMSVVQCVGGFDSQPGDVLAEGPVLMREARRSSLI